MILNSNGYIQYITNDNNNSKELEQFIYEMNKFNSKFYDESIYPINVTTENNKLVFNNKWEVGVVVGASVGADNTFIIKHKTKNNSIQKTKNISIQIGKQQISSEIITPSIVYNNINYSNSSIEGGDGFLKLDTLYIGTNKDENTFNLGNNKFSIVNNNNIKGWKIEEDVPDTSNYELLFNGPKNIIYNETNKSAIIKFGKNGKWSMEVYNKTIDNIDKEVIIINYTENYRNNHFWIISDEKIEYKNKINKVLSENTKRYYINVSPECLEIGKWKIKNVSNTTKFSYNNNNNNKVFSFNVNTNNVNTNQIITNDTMGNFYIEDLKNLIICPPKNIVRMYPSEPVSLSNEHKIKKLINGIQFGERFILKKDLFIIDNDNSKTTIDDNIYTYSIFRDKINKLNNNFYFNKNTTKSNYIKYYCNELINNMNNNWKVCIQFGEHWRMGVIEEKIVKNNNPITKSYFIISRKINNTEYIGVVYYYDSTLNKIIRINDIKKTKIQGPIKLKQIWEEIKTELFNDKKNNTRNKDGRLRLNNYIIMSNKLIEFNNDYNTDVYNKTGLWRIYIDNNAFKIGYKSSDNKKFISLRINNINNDATIDYDKGIEKENTSSNHYYYDRNNTLDINDISDPLTAKDNTYEYITDTTNKDMLYIDCSDNTNTNAILYFKCTNNNFIIQYNYFDNITNNNNRKYVNLINIDIRNINDKINNKTLYNNKLLYFENISALPSYESYKYFNTHIYPIINKNNNYNLNKNSNAKYTENSVNPVSYLDYNKTSITQSNISNNNKDYFIISKINNNNNNKKIILAIRNDGYVTTILPKVEGKILKNVYFQNIANNTFDNSSNVFIGDLFIEFSNKWRFGAINNKIILAYNDKKIKYSIDINTSNDANTVINDIIKINQHLDDQQSHTDADEIWKKPLTYKNAGLSNKFIKIENDTTNLIIGQQGNNNSSNIFIIGLINKTTVTGLLIQYNLLNNYIIDIKNSSLKTNLNYYNNMTLPIIDIYNLIKKSEIYFPDVDMKKQFNSIKGNYVINYYDSNNNIIEDKTVLYIIYNGKIDVYENRNKTNNIQTIDKYIRQIGEGYIRSIEDTNLSDEIKNKYKNKNWYYIPTNILENTVEYLQLRQNNIIKIEQEEKIGNITKKYIGFGYNIVDVDNGGWKLVTRLVSRKGQGYSNIIKNSALSLLNGDIVFNEQYRENFSLGDTSFTINYVYDNYDQYMFTNGLGNKWVIVSKSEIKNINNNNTNIIKAESSSENSRQHNIKINKNTDGITIYLNNNTDYIIYSSYKEQIENNYNGYNVYIRKKIVLFESEIIENKTTIQTINNETKLQDILIKHPEIKCNNSIISSIRLDKAHKDTTEDLWKKRQSGLDESKYNQFQYNYKCKDVSNYWSGLSAEQLETKITQNYEMIHPNNLELFDINCNKEGQGLLSYIKLNKHDSDINSNTFGTAMPEVQKLAREQEILKKINNNSDILISVNTTVKKDQNIEINQNIDLNNIRELLKKHKVIILKNTISDMLIVKFNDNLIEDEQKIQRIKNGIVFYKDNKIFENYGINWFVYESYYDYYKNDPIDKNVLIDKLKKIYQQPLLLN